MGLGYLLGMACWIIPTISVAIRRLHDIGKSGLWVFLVQIPVPGGTTRNSSCVWNVGVWGVRGTPKHFPPHLGLLEKVIITAAVLDGGGCFDYYPRQPSTYYLSV